MNSARSRLVWMALLALAGCSQAPAPWQPTSPGTNGGNTNGGNTDGGTTTVASDDGGTAVAGDLPCDVATLLGNRCASCHSSPPIGGAPRSLASYADLMAPSATNPTRTEAEVALERMQSTAAPMPPAPAASATATEIAALQAWVDAGMPAGSCGAPTNPYDTPTTCSTGAHWTRGNHESPLMRPGGACISCHQGGEGPWFSLAGTVYASAHEPNDCTGGATAGGSPTVEITDASGHVFSLNVNSAGNFFTQQAVSTPYTARVLYQGRARAMVTPQTSGDCNTCHTETGANGAPGRVMLP